VQSAMYAVHSTQYAVHTTRSMQTQYEACSTHNTQYADTV